MSNIIQVAILENHQGIIDGYQFRLGQTEDIRIAGIARFGSEIEPLLASTRVDVLILDINAPTDPNNNRPYPIFNLISSQMDLHPHLHILIISMHAQPVMARSLCQAGISGYILKEDHNGITRLAEIIRSIQTGGIYFSPLIQEYISQADQSDKKQKLSRRQVEALSVLAAFPGITTEQLAARLNLTHASLRNLLSTAYMRLEVCNRTEAVLKIQELGLLLPPDNLHFP